jgi:hypothetical protein
VCAFISFSTMFLFFFANVALFRTNTTLYLRTRHGGHRQWQRFHVSFPSVSLVIFTKGGATG